jgi:hypothetical protein
MAAISTGADSCGEFAGCEMVVLPILCGLTTAAIAIRLWERPMAAISSGADSCGGFAGCEKVVLPILGGLTTAAIARGHGPLLRVVLLNNQQGHEVVYRSVGEFFLVCAKSVKFLPLSVT